MKKYIEVLRPKKWFLNLLILVPLFLSQNLLDRSLLMKVGLGFLVFCVAASASYSINDLFERRDEKHHAEDAPAAVTKNKARSLARVFLAILLVLAALVGSFMLNAEFGLIILTYLVISLWLSAWLQNVAVVDVCLRMILAALRIVAGAVLIQAVVPIFVIIVVAFGVAAVFFGKRLHATTTEPQPTSGATVLYEQSFLRGAFPLLSSLFVSSYILLSLSVFAEGGPLGLANNNLFYCNIFVLFLTLVFMQNVYSKNKKSPFSDPRIVIGSLTYLIFTYLFLYTFKG